MLRSPGAKAEKLLATNVKLEERALYFQAKVGRIKEQIHANKYKAQDLLAQERQLRKFKVE